MKWKNYLGVSFEYLLIVFILGFSVLIVLQQANPMLSDLGRDAGAFAYIGNQIRHGQILYLDMWDSKPPGIFFINALGLSLIKGSRWGIWVVEYLFLSLILLYLDSLPSKKIFGLVTALPLLLPSFGLYGLNATLKGGDFTEEYSLLFGFFSMFLFVWSLGKPDTVWNDIGIGFCAGSSFLFRLNNIGPQITIVLTICILLLVDGQYMVIFKEVDNDEHCRI